MDIDLAALRALERERDISLDMLIPAIEQALLVAYHRTDGAYRIARVELDRKTGHVIVWAARGAATARRDRGGRAPPARRARARVRRHPGRASAGSRPRPPARSSSSGCATSRTRRSWATSRAARATSSPASSSRAPTRATCSSTSARSRASCRSPSRCRGRSTSTASGCAASSCQRQARAARARRSACRAPTPTWCASCSPSRCPRSPTARSRSRRWPARPATAPRSPCTPRSPGVNAKGACIGPMGARVRAVMTELHGEKIDIVDYSEDPADVRGGRAVARRGCSRSRSSTRRLRSARVVVPDYQLSPRHRQGGAERPPRRQADRLADRHPPRHRGRPPAPARTGRGGARRRPPRAAERTVRRRAPVGQLAAPGRGRLRLWPTGLRTPSPSRPGRVWDAAGRIAGRHCCEWSRRRTETAGACSGLLCPDPRHRLPGRGAWLHPDARLFRAGRAPQGVRTGPAPAGPRRT